MSIIAGLVLIFFAIRSEAAVTFKDTQILQGPDFAHEQTEFRCEEECIVYTSAQLHKGLSISALSPEGTSTLVKTFEGIERNVDKNGFIRGLRLVPKYNEIYRITNTNDASGVFYGVQKASAFYNNTTVISAGSNGLIGSFERVRRTFTVDTQYVTIISSNVMFAITNVQTDAKVKIYTAGADFSELGCRPVYASRSAENAAKAVITIIGPIATIDFGDVKEGRKFSINNDFAFAGPSFAPLSTRVAVSPGYVGCSSNKAEKYSSNLDTVVYEFTSSENSYGTYNVEGDVNIPNKNESVLVIDHLGPSRLFGTDPIKTTLVARENGHITFIWSRNTPNSYFAFQIDAESDAATSTPTTATSASTEVTPTTASQTTKPLI